MKKVLTTALVALMLLCTAAVQAQSQSKLEKELEN